MLPSHYSQTHTIYTVSSTNNFITTQPLPSPSDTLPFAPAATINILYIAIMQPILFLLPFLPLLAAKKSKVVNTDPYTGFNLTSSDWSLEFDTTMVYGVPFKVCCYVSVENAFGCSGFASFGKCQDGGTPSDLCANVTETGPITSHLDDTDGCAKDATVTVNFSSGCPEISFQQNIGQPDESIIECTAGIDNLVDGDYTRKPSFDDLSHCNLTSSEVYCPS